MNQPDNNAETRLREREFTIHEEAAGDVSEEFRMWHKLRPMLERHNRLAQHASARKPGSDDNSG